MIEVINLTKIKIDKEYFQKIGRVVFKKLKLSEKSAIRTCSLRSQNLVSSRCSKISLAFINDAEMKKWNKIYRGKNKTTDVLSFSYKNKKIHPDPSRIKRGTSSLQKEGMIGEIVISISQAKKQAKKRGYPLKRELSELFVHGILHLVGYNDEKKEDYEKMIKKQEEILNAFNN